MPFGPQLAPIGAASAVTEALAPRPRLDCITGALMQAEWKIAEGADRTYLHGARGVRTNSAPPPAEQTRWMTSEEPQQRRAENEQSFSTASAVIMNYSAPWRTQVGHLTDPERHSFRGFTASRNRFYPSDDSADIVHVSLTTNNG